MVTAPTRAYIIELACGRVDAVGSPISALVRRHVGLAAGSVHARGSGIYASLRTPMMDEDDEWLLLELL